MPKYILFPIDEGLRRRAKAAAAQQGLTLRAWLAQAVEAHIDPILGSPDIGPHGPSDLEAIIAEEVGRG